MLIGMVQTEISAAGVSSRLAVNPHYCLCAFVLAAPGSHLLQTRTLITTHVKALLPPQSGSLHKRKIKTQGDFLDPGLRQQKGGSANVLASFCVSTHRFQKALQSSKSTELRGAHQEFSRQSCLASGLHHQVSVSQIWKWTNVRLLSTFE